MDADEVGADATAAGLIRAPDDAFPGEFASTPRGEVFVRALRSGREPALFVHGLGGESLDWSDVAGLVADRVDPYALDLPGFGCSLPPDDGDLSIDGHARAVADVVHAIGRAIGHAIGRATGHGPVHLVGNSLGGAVAVRLAAERPELVRSLALISPAMPDLRPRKATLEMLPALLPVLGPSIIERVLTEDPEWLARQVFATCYGNPESVTPSRWTAEIDAIRRRAELPHSPVVYRASLRSLAASYLWPGRRRLWRQAQRIAVPTLVIHGARDKLVDHRQIARALRTFPDARGVLMAHAGHVAQLEFPGEVAMMYRQFLDGALPRGMYERRGTVDASADVVCAPCAVPVDRRPL